jgi:hypothetical protein
MPEDEDLRALWQSQPAAHPAISVAELVKREAKLARVVRFRNAREYVAAALVVGIFGAMAVRPPDLHLTSTVPLRLASAAIVIAVVYVVVMVRRRGTSLPPPAPDAPLAEHLGHHRASLVRQRDLLRNVWRWYLGPLAAGTLLFELAMAFTMPMKMTLATILVRWVRPLVLIAAFYVFLGWANGRAARGLDAKIAALDD